MNTKFKSLKNLDLIWKGKLFNDFVDANDDERVLMLSKCGLLLDKVYSGKYDERTGYVKIPSIKNPFSDETLYAKLISKKNNLKDGRNLNVLLKYEISDDINTTPENIFKCEALSEVKNDFYRVTGQAVISQFDKASISLIVNLYFKISLGSQDSIKEEYMIKRLNKLICVGEDNIKSHLKKVGKVAKDYKLHGEKQISGHSNEQIMRLLITFYNDREKFFNIVRESFIIKANERWWDIIDTMYVSKYKNELFNENPSRKIKLVMNDKTLEKLKQQNRLYYIHSNQDMSCNSNEELKLFCAIPKERICSIYSNEKNIYSVQTINDIINIHRNGAVSRDVKIIDYFEDNIPNKSQEKKSKKKKKGKKILEKPAMSEMEKKEDPFYYKFDEAFFFEENLRTNEAVKSLKNVKNRVSVSSLKASEPFTCFTTGNAIKQMQLIRGMRNHVTLGHNINNKKATFVYYDNKQGMFVCIEMLVHYCEKCKCYFDFYHSFLEQLKNAGISRASLVLRYFDENGREIFFDDIFLREHSKLNLLGYRAGLSGLSKEKRQGLLEYIIDEKYMSPAEIKSHLEFLINYRGKESRMSYAKKCWEEDILYINQIAKRNI